MTNPSRPLDVANELAYRSGDAKLDFVDSSRENFRYREIAVLASVLRRRRRWFWPPVDVHGELSPIPDVPVLGVTRPS
ncbi:MAG TPA: hypothetical protein VJ255_09250 [Candidatus Acidoferrum sp.]|nr:hypothetical protein [Candidatus Acidoferrum sp.]